MPRAALVQLGPTSPWAHPNSDYSLQWQEMTRACLDQYPSVQLLHHLLDFLLAVSVTGAFSLHTYCILITLATACHLHEIACMLTYGFGEVRGSSLSTGVLGASSLQSQGSQLQRALRQKKSALSASTSWARRTLSLKVHAVICYQDPAADPAVTRQHLQCFRLIRTDSLHHLAA